MDFEMSTWLRSLFPTADMKNTIPFKHTTINCNPKNNHVLNYISYICTYGICKFMITKMNKSKIGELRNHHYQSSVLIKVRSPLEKRQKELVSLPSVRTTMQKCMNTFSGQSSSDKQTTSEGVASWTELARMWLLVPG
jgi:hypothetical protein